MDKNMVFYDYFDRITITHLPDRKDRYDSLARELRAMVLIAGNPGLMIQMRNYLRERWKRRIQC